MLGTVSHSTGDRAPCYCAFHFDALGDPKYVSEPNEFSAWMDLHRRLTHGSVCQFDLAAESLIFAKLQGIA